MAPQRCTEGYGCSIVAPQRCTGGWAGGASIPIPQGWCLDLLLAHDAKNCHALNVICAGQWPHTHFSVATNMMHTGTN